MRIKLRTYTSPLARQPVYETIQDKLNVQQKKFVFDKTSQRKKKIEVV